MEEPKDELTYRRRMPIQIRFNDADSYGHVNNNAYFSYYDLGKMDYLNSVMGADGKAHGIVPIVANISADFFHPVFYGDEIVVETCIPRIGRKSFTLQQRAVNLKTNTVVCRCSTVMVCFSLKEKKSVEVPADFRAAIERFERDE